METKVNVVAVTIASFLFKLAIGIQHDAIYAGQVGIHCSHFQQWHSHY